MSNDELNTKDYRDAINVQDACNLSGVAASFSRVMMKIWATARATGNDNTKWVNEHPISVMYANKIAQLTGQSVYDVLPFSRAYDACRKLGNEEDV